MNTTTAALPEALLPSTISYQPDFTPEPIRTQDIEPARRAMFEDAARRRVKTLSDRYAKNARWQIACQRHINGEVAELDVRKMPSRQTAAWMYDDARVVRFYLASLGLQNVPGRPHRLYAIGEIVKIARQFLGMRDLVL